MTEQPYQGTGQTSLVIKRTHFDKILSGEQKQETREIRHNTAWKYCNLDKDGEFQGLKTPATLELLEGYNANRRTAIVEVTGVTLEVETYKDKDGTEKDATYLHNGVEYLVCFVIFELGKVVSTTNVQP